MGLFGSLFTGVSALFAQSQNTAIISNNIANVNTVGFKRSEAAFQSLVTTASRTARYSPGTVSINRIQAVKLQGSTQQTSSATDASISGNGFFPVKRSTDSSQEFLYTRAGEFSEDASGLLKNAAGFILYAWPIDAAGDLPSNLGDPVSLVPANVAFLGGLTRPTTNADIAINLNASQDDFNSGSLFAAGPTQFGTTGFTGFPISTATPADFSRGLTIYDALGAPETVTLQFRKTTGPEATAQSESTTVLDRDTLLTSMPGIAAGNTFSVTVTGTAATVYTVVAGAPVAAGDVQTVGDLMDQLNQTYGGGTELNAFLNPSGQLQLEAQTFGDSITLTDILGTPLFGANGFAFPEIVVNGTETYDPFVLDGSIAQSADNPYGFTVLSQNQADFPTLQNTATPNSRGWWEMKVLKEDGSIITQGLMNFNGDGTLNASANSSGNIEISLDQVDWGTGAALQDLTIDVSKFSQFSGNFDVISSDQNGAALGLRTGVEINRDGVVVAQFSNGATAELYKIPLVTFANPNGLNEVSGTAYSQNDLSGPNNLREAGTGGAGFVEPSTLEASNVDLADEFAKLIVAQRAFGAGTRVITTVDQMTQDLLNLR